MNHSHDVWDDLRAVPPTSIAVGERTLCVGQRVRLTPRSDVDVMDTALAGRTAIIESIDVTTDGEPHLSVTIDDDPGRDLGSARYPGHRFFFRPDEVEILDGANASRTLVPRILVAGIGNIFFGDDGFGVAVARRLAEREKPAGVTIRDFGIRGLDLAYALQDDYDAAILIDAVPRGGAPGTLYVIEPDLDAAATEGVPVDAHGMDPVRVLHLARSLGRIPEKTLVVGCEPGAIAAGAEAAANDGYAALSSPVAAAIENAIHLVTSLLSSVTSSPPQ